MPDIEIEVIVEEAEPAVTVEVPGPQGPEGPPGNGGEIELQDLTILFENRLI